jgi:hypothetical protein
MQKLFAVVRNVLAFLAHLSNREDLPDDVRDRATELMHELGEEHDRITDESN